METPAEPKTSEDQECTAMCRISEDQNADDTRTSEVQSPAETNTPQEQIGATESKTMKDSDPVAQSEQQVSPFFTRNILVMSQIHRGGKKTIY